MQSDAEPKPKILLVEDDPTIVAMSKTALTVAGYSVLTAGSVAKGMESYRENSPDLVILDIQLPDGSGLNLCKEIRKEDGQSVPVLFLTSLADVETRIAGFDAGANDYIVKPFSMEEVKARARVHIQGKRSGDVLMRRNRALELQQRARQDLADMIVHDLKTPLTAIQGTLSLVREIYPPDSPKAAQLLEVSTGAADLMLLMINDLLDISRGEDGGLEVKLELVQISEIFQRLEKLFSAIYVRRGYSLRFVANPPELKWNTDLILVYRVLADYLSNAAKYGGENGAEVLVSAEEVDGLLRLSVSDRGPGIPEDKKKEVFGKFVRLQHDPEAIEKTGGIGLSFCLLAAKSLGGTVFVEDREGGGSTFVLELKKKSL
jgi:signal transduction histidine kinase